jgi:hypothetical protein
MYGNVEYVFWDVNHVGWEKFTDIFEEPDFMGSLRVPIPNPCTQIAFQSQFTLLS